MKIQTSNVLVFTFKVESLLANGANHTARTDIQGETPLHIAARHGNVEGLRKLLEGGADVNVRDIHGRTPLHLAVSADAVAAFKVCANRIKSD